VGDFNGDGRADIFWRNTSTGQDTIWNSGNNATQRAVASVSTQAWKVVAVGDYDADGKSDLLWRSTIGAGSNTIWRGGDNATQTAVSAVSDQAWTVVPYEFQP
jgi:hypothetical protein